MIRFETLTLEDVEKVRKFRNDNLEALRTPFGLTKEQQEDFYKSVVCNRRSNARYFAIRKGEFLIGMCGLENIEWENGLAEISIILEPGQRGKNFGEECVDYLLKHAFENLRMNTIYGECYECNPSLRFWQKIVDKYDMYKTSLPDRKYYKGKFQNSLYFSISSYQYKGLPEVVGEDYTIDTKSARINEKGEGLNA